MFGLEVVEGLTEYRDCLVLNTYSGKERKHTRLASGFWKIRSRESLARGSEAPVVGCNRVGLFHDRSPWIFVYFFVLK